MSSTNVQFSVGVHILLVIGFFPPGEVSSERLGYSLKADPSFVRRALAKLSKAGLVKASRGRSGGCCLARSPDAITLLDIYIATEAPKVFAIHGYAVQRRCPVSVVYRSVMERLRSDSQAALEARLASRTLADLLRETR